MMPSKDQIQITLNQVLNLIKLWLERKQFPQNISLFSAGQILLEQNSTACLEFSWQGDLIYELLLKGAAGKQSLEWATRNLDFSWTVLSLCALHADIQSPSPTVSIYQTSKLNELSLKCLLTLNTSDSQGSHISADFKILVFLKLSIL